MPATGSILFLSLSLSFSFCLSLSVSLSLLSVSLSSGSFEGNSEQETTLNQLLVEMDGRIILLTLT